MHVQGGSYLERRLVPGVVIPVLQALGKLPTSEYVRDTYLEEVVQTVHECCLDVLFRVGQSVKVIATYVPSH